MKALLAGQSVDFKGTPGKLDFAAGRDIPVIMAASGPKSIELAGEVADGVLVLVGFTPWYCQTRCSPVLSGVPNAVDAALKSWTLFGRSVPVPPTRRPKLATPGSAHRQSTGVF